MIPDSDHNQVLTPDVLSGVSLNYEWRKIVVGILERELPKLAPVDISENDLQTYEARIGALIEDIYTVETQQTMSWVDFNLFRTSNQAIVAGANTITWQFGSVFDNSNPTRLATDAPGMMIITAHFQVSAPSGRTLLVNIRKNGGEVVGHYQHNVGLTLQRCTLTTQDFAFAGDYYELVINIGGTGTFEFSLEPQFFATLLENP